MPNNNLNNQVEAQPRVNERKQHQEPVNVDNKKKSDEDEEEKVGSFDLMYEKKVIIKILIVDIMQLIIL
ncbi:MAG: hypothetical protein LBM05_02280 [Endomicrobium sp.]|nr:hypothetical protein [Endomicrobium sp.]